MEQSRSNAARDVHAADSVAVGWAGLGQGTTQFGRSHQSGRTAARPIGRRVEAALVTVRPLVAVGAAAGVDDVGIGLADMLHIDLQLGSSRGQVIGQEHVAGRRDLIDQLSSLFRRQVDADAALAPVGVLHQGVAVLVGRKSLQHLDAALSVAAHGMLDLDDVGAPIGQHRASRRYKSELCDLKNPHALHYLGHVSLPAPSSDARAAAVAHLGQPSVTA